MADAYVLPSKRDLRDDVMAMSRLLTGAPLNARPKLILLHLLTRQGHDYYDYIGGYA